MLELEGILAVTYISFHFLRRTSSVPISLRVLASEEAKFEPDLLSLERILRTIMC